MSGLAAARRYSASSTASPPDPEAVVPHTLAALSASPGHTQAVGELLPLLARCHSRPCARHRLWSNRHRPRWPRRREVVTHPTNWSGGNGHSALRTLWPVSARGSNSAAPEGDCGMFFSVVITVYERDQVFLPRALTGLLNQSCRDFELIIVVDGEEPLAPYEPHLICTR